MGGELGGEEEGRGLEREEGGGGERERGEREVGGEEGIRGGVGGRKLLAGGGGKEVEAAGEGLLGEMGGGKGETGRTGGEATWLVLRGGGRGAGMEANPEEMGMEAQETEPTVSAKGEGEAGV